ncbi:MAG: hypothetical protein AAFS10_00615 [Myxococcota bacterium]
MVRSMCVCMLVFMVFLNTTTGFAEPSGLSPQTPSEGSEEPSEPTAAAAWVREHDAASTRGILSGRAETLPEGDFLLSNDQVLFPGLGYGFTERFQLNALVLIPTGSLNMVLLTGKYVLSRTDNTVISVGGNMVWAQAPDTSEATRGEEGFVAMFGGPSLWIDHYLGDGTLALHGAIDSALLVVGGETLDTVALAAEAAARISGGLTLKASDGVRLMTEWTSGTFYTSSEGLETPGALFNYGIRFHGPTVAGDVAFLKPLGHGSDEVYAIGLPYVRLAVRF